MSRLNFTVNVLQLEVTDTEKSVTVLEHTTAFLKLFFYADFYRFQEHHFYMWSQEVL